MICRCERTETGAEHCDRCDDDERASHTSRLRLLLAVLIQGEEDQNKCLVRARLGNKKLSTIVSLPQPIAVRLRSTSCRLFHRACQLSEHDVLWQLELKDHAIMGKLMEIMRENMSSMKKPVREKDKKKEEKKKAAAREAMASPK